MLFFLLFIVLNNINYSNNLEKCGKFSYITRKNVILRNGPSKDYREIFTTLRDKIIILEKYKIDNWYYVESQDGNLGWIESKYIKNKKNNASLKIDSFLKRMPNKGAENILKIKKYENIKILYCNKFQNSWCRIELNKNITGWLEKKKLWGIECN